MVTLFKIMTRGRISIFLFTTKTSLKTFTKALDNLSDEVNTKFDLNIYYRGDWDAHDIVVDKLCRSILDSDVILLDIRSRVPELIADIVENSKAKVIVPLVPATPGVVSLLRLGNFSGKVIAKRMEGNAQKDLRKTFKIVGAIEKVGSILPIGSLRHYKNWILLTKYWAYWGEENLKNMLKLILSEYFGFRVRYDKPVEWGSLTFWDSEVGFYEDPKIRKPAVAIFMYSGMHFEQNTPVALRFKKYLEENGINVICVVGGVTESLLEQVKMFEKIDVDAVVNLQWFLINGGPYGGPLEPTREIFLKKGFLLFNGLIMYMNRVSRWLKDDRGLLPIETVAGVMLPEMDGAIEPIPSAGLDDSDLSEIVVIEDRIERKAKRIANWIRLRYKIPAERRVALIIYNYPPGEHNVGSASYLDTLKSIEVLLKAMKDRGYDVDVLSKDELKRRIPLLTNSPMWSEHEGLTLDVREYIKYFDKIGGKEKFIKIWGKPPGNVNVSDGKFAIPGIVLGKVFVGVQPPRGGHEKIYDEDKVYHSKDLPPHHQYIAFYYWLRNVFKADVIAHLGTHGTLEFMPGKEIGLTKDCWPDVLIGDVPHVYVYHVTNPSEMAIAKRRGYAYVITHGTPPFANAELYGEYAEIERLLEEYEETEGESREVIKKMIEKKCKSLNLDVKFEELRDYIYEMKMAVIPKGLHVIGDRWCDDEIIDYLLFVLRKDGEVKSLHRLIAEERGLDYESIDEATFYEIESEARELLVNAMRGEFPRKRDFKKTLEYALDLAEKIRRSNEIGGILRALDGLYVEPRVAGDPVRTPEVFPTGSHGYTFDARLIPSEGAIIRGAKIAEETIKKYYEKHGRYPESVALVLWGFETAQTRGETIGQILHYLGVRLVRRQGPWAPELELIPIDKLGRPRIDVVVTICGIFRDIFPNLIELIDRAVRMVAEADEDPEVNYVRKHYLEDGTTFRIFGPKPGAYNTRLTDVIESSKWESEKELVEIYLGDMMYAYGEDVHGKEASKELLNSLKRVEMVCQIRSSAEYEITDLDHYYEFFGGLKKTVESIRGRKIESYWIDTLSHRIRMRSSDEAIGFAVRTRILNPKWVEEMLKHGYDGAREIAKRVEYLLGHSALTGVESWVWDKVWETYILNDEVREKIARENPWALYEITKRLYEAHKRNYWKADSRKLEKLREVAGEIEPLLEV